LTKFHLTVIRPAGYPHSSCFHEVMEALYAGLTQLGHEATGGENSVVPDAVNIVFGAHLLDENVAMGLDPSTVIYNLEQLGVWWLPPWYARLAERYQIWDYTPINIAVWQALPCLRPPVLVEVAYMPMLRRIPVAAVQNVDILFYGMVDHGRIETFHFLERAGLKVHCLQGIYGAARDEVISRSRLVLNLHAHSMGLFEIVRVSYLLANSKAIVSQHSPDIGYLAQAVAVADPIHMARVCRELLDDDARRHALEQRGFELFSANSLLTSLSAAIESLT
jgi:hypothetical protein